MSRLRHTLELGVYMIEMDVHFSEDGIPVVIHDSRLERTTNGTGFVSSKTFKALSRLDAGVSMITGNNPEPALRILRQQGLHR